MKLAEVEAYISLAQTYRKGFGIETLHCPRPIQGFREQNVSLN